MANIVRNKLVRAGAWRTLESGWNVEFSCFFLGPYGAQIRVLYGWWIFSWSRQKQTLDGEREKSVGASRAASLAYARIQMKVQQDAQVGYTYVRPGP